ncbi:guanylin-like isoform X1 [Heptranchias perlo]|uniref:guanylin-like isoform X1 n=1 Tax=Heptranchias perlo TaxID=212740 RepID=UPI00355A4D6E
MKTLFAFVLLSSSLSSVLAVIIVQIGGFKFSVNDVIQLKPLMDQEAIKTPHSAYSSVTALCSNSALPEGFQQVCAKSDAPQIFDTLNHIANFPYPCIICAYTICTGCT